MRCKMCARLLIDLTGQREFIAERYGLCWDCLNGNTKRCGCGKLYTFDKRFKNYECNDCAHERIKERVKPKREDYRDSEVAVESPVRDADCLEGF